MNGLVIFAKDVARVSAFYEQTLGARLIDEDKSHRLLQTDDFEIVIHALSAAAAKAITIENPPLARGQSALKPAFAVADLAAVRDAAIACGGVLKPLKTAWTIRGNQVLDGHDPEGNVVQFKQPI